MARIVERSLKKRRRGGSNLDARQIVTLQGRRVKARLVDAESDTLGSDLLEAFGRSVERARRENRQQLGSSDGTDGGD